MAALLALIPGFGIGKIIDFFKTPVGQFLLIALAIGGAFIGGKVRENFRLTAIHKQEIVAINAAWKAKIDKAAADFEKAKTARAAQVVAEIEAANKPRIAALETREAQLQQQLAEYERRMAAQPSEAACQLKPEDLPPAAAPPPTVKRRRFP